MCTSISNLCYSSASVSGEGRFTKNDVHALATGSLNSTGSAAEDTSRDTRGGCGSRGGGGGRLCVHNSAGEESKEELCFGSEHVVQGGFSEGESKNRDEWRRILSNVLKSLRISI
jgi:hypothetical protein